MNEKRLCARAIVAGFLVGEFVRIGIRLGERQR
jgi:hypothetical protein